MTKRGTSGSIAGGCRLAFVEKGAKTEKGRALTITVYVIHRGTDTEAPNPCGAS
jgi:hypothetical protein